LSVLRIVLCARLARKPAGRQIAIDFPGERPNVFGAPFAGKWIKKRWLAFLQPSDL